MLPHLDIPQEVKSARISVQTGDAREMFSPSVSLGPRVGGAYTADKSLGKLATVRVRVPPTDQVMEFRMNYQVRYDGGCWLSCYEEIHPRAHCAHDTRYINASYKRYGLVDKKLLLWLRLKNVFRGVRKLVKIP